MPVILNETVPVDHDGARLRGRNLFLLDALLERSISENLIARTLIRYRDRMMSEATPSDGAALALKFIDNAIC
ncbi:hypothetical protein Rleg5DRAFT_1476 [Rhizobium leguminosarum bv. viciae WSM1455]|nr:hypothetical protein Rleg5DRAFT_1476 [Rhizobium leguminosarum bv. viciae WSM1455]